MYKFKADTFEEAEAGHRLAVRNGNLHRNFSGPLALMWDGTEAEYFPIDTANTLIPEDGAEAVLCELAREQFFGVVVGIA